MSALITFFLIFILLIYFGKLLRESKRPEEFEEEDDIQVVVKFGDFKNGEFIEFQEKNKVVSWPEWNNKEFDAAKEVSGRHAKPGFYDESYFINPKTGKFKLPRYRHQAQFMVKIVDETDYKDGFLSDCYNKYERESYGMVDFENDAEYMIYLVVDEFNVIFEKKYKKKLGDYSQFSTHYDYIECYIYIVEESELKEYKTRADQFLVDYGYLVEKEEMFDKEKAKKVMYRMLVKELALLCDKYDVKHGKKVDMIEDLLNHGYVPEQFKSITVSQKFTDAMEALADIYIDDIKGNLERFHPMYIPFAWESVLDVNREVPVIKGKINEVINSYYWREKLI